MSYIVPREKPKKCRDCNFMDRISFDCRLTVADYPDFYSQYANCPLIEVPPHGRLILENGEEYEITRFKRGYNRYAEGSEEKES